MVIRNAIYYIDSEIDLIRMELEHPERFLAFTDDNSPTLKWNGTVSELLEYLIPLQMDGKLSKPSGEVMSYTDLVKLIELVCGITIPAPYDRKTKLFSRMKNPTPFIDKMRQIFREGSKKMNQ